MDEDEEEGSLDNPVKLQECLSALRCLTDRVETAERDLAMVLNYIRGCPVHGTALCPEEYMLYKDGSIRPGYAADWQESIRCGQRPARPEILISSREI